MHNIYIWQQVIWQRLMQNHGFRNQALLLKGKKGIGKFKFAHDLAKSLLCRNLSAHNGACEKCISCHWFEQNEHPNFYQIAPELFSESSDNSIEKIDTENITNDKKLKKKNSQQIGVEQIRMLTDFVYMTGHQSGFKIILIYPAETMNLAAASALLKKLEEPPPQVLFILVTHRPQYLLPTIRSRCQQIAMPSPDIATATEWLKQQGVNEPAACLAAASFAPLSALAFNAGDYVIQHEQFIEQISAAKHLDPVLLAETMQQLDLSTVVNWLQKWCHDLMSFHTTGEVRYYLNHYPAVKALSSTVDPKKLMAYSRRLITAQRLSRHPLNSRLFLEEILIIYAMLWH